ncbi:MAG: alpha/beta fold hydrolase [Syntrophobacterales bacterium]
MRTDKLLIFCTVVVAILVCSSCPKTEQGVRTELIELQTTDGVRLDSVLREPYPGRARAGVVMVHGYGGNFYSGIMAFLPQALSRRGFATLALNMRDHDLGPKKNLFEENLPDIVSGVDEMARHGYEALFLYGHSMGTNRVLFYLAETEDPRIGGVILTGPPGNLFQWNVRTFGLEAATQLLHRAQELKAEGKGDTWMLIDLGPLGKTLYTAKHVISLRGPQTLSDPFMNIARLSKPVLIVHGLADRLADPQVADQLQNNAGTGSHVTVRKVGGADHRFREHEKELEEIITQWLVEQIKQ